MPTLVYYSEWPNDYKAGYIMYIMSLLLAFHSLTILCHLASNSFASFILILDVHLDKGRPVLMAIAHLKYEEGAQDSNVHVRTMQTQMQKSNSTR